MLCSEIETSSLSHPFSSSFALLSLLLATPSFPFFHISHISVYISPRICPYRFHSPYLFPSLSQIVCHLCDQWSSFFSGNSAMMDFFFAVLCLALYFLEGVGEVCVLGGQFASVHESSEWSRGKVMFWCLSSNTRQFLTLRRVQQLRGKVVVEIFYSSARYSARGISKAALICSRATKATSKKNRRIGEWPNRWRGGGVCSCHAIQTRRNGTTRTFWSIVDTFCFGNVWQPLKLTEKTEKFNRAASYLGLNISITNLMCLCVFRQQLAVEDSIVATSLVLHWVTCLNTLADGYPNHADMKESPDHVCSCFFVPASN